MELTTALMGRGYDPQIGYLHETGRGRPSLALDLVETQRGRIDLFVWRLFREERLRPEHFSRKEGAALLGKAGRRIFYEAFDEEAEHLQKQRTRLCILLGKVLAGASIKQIEEAVGETAVSHP